MSFIGHSLGGLIIRSALEHLEKFSPKMHLYMTLSSPHLGYMYNSSKIIDAGRILIINNNYQILRYVDSKKMEEKHFINATFND